MFMQINDVQELVGYVVRDVKQAVVSTMGPNGKLAAIGVGTSVKVTKDGVTVAKSIKFANNFQEYVNKIMTEPAIKTDVECGDGTTTTILLTAGLYELYKKYPNYRERKFIDRVGAGIIEHLTRMAKKIDNKSPLLYSLAHTSSNGDERLAQAIVDIYGGSGDKFPEIELKEGISSDDAIVRADGLIVNMLFANPSFSKSGNGGETEYTDFVPVIIDENLRNISTHTLVEKLSKIQKVHPQSQILVIARQIDHPIVSAMLTINNQLQKQTLVGIQTNFGGSVGTLLMQDISILFDAPLFKSFDDIDTRIPNPVSETIVVGDRRSIFNVTTAATQARIFRQVAKIEEELGGYERGDRFSLRARFNETRIRNFNGELVTVFVGGETTSEVKERLDRFEDVNKAVKSALINGILPGVGTALITAGVFAIHDVDTRDDIQVDTVEDRILKDIEQLVYSQYMLLQKETLFADVSPEGRGIAALRFIKHTSAHLIDMDSVEKIPVFNLATGVTGTAEELGIYDTAYASITALRGGMQTAKILASLDSILLGDKLSAIQMQQ